MNEYSLEQSIKVLLEPGGVAELRLLGTGKGVVSGYFDDPTKLAEAANEWNGRAEGIYFTLNPVNRDLLARSANHLKEYAKHTTSDTDILHRQWLPIDFDPVRPAGISSTDEEHLAAINRAKEARDWLRKEGWPEPILADSGNGAHLLCGINLPNDTNSTNLIKRCLEAVAFQFNDDKVTVDVTTCNAARIWKLYGTHACKGDNLPERPHRLAQILEVPS